MNGKELEREYEVYRQGRGKLPWAVSEANPRVILDANGAVVGMMDTADIAGFVVASANDTKRVN